MGWYRCHCHAHRPSILINMLPLSLGISSEETDKSSYNNTMLYAQQTCSKISIQSHLLQQHHALCSTNIQQDIHPEPSLTTTPCFMLNKHAARYPCRAITYNNTMLYTQQRCSKISIQGHLLQQHHALCSTNMQQDIHPDPSHISRVTKFS